MSAGRFSEFVIEFVKTYNEERKEEFNWQYYLHKVDPQVSYNEFVSEMETDEKLQNMTDDDKADALQTAFDILGNFNPLQEKG